MPTDEHTPNDAVNASPTFTAQLSTPEERTMAAAIVRNRLDYGATFAEAAFAARMMIAERRRMIDVGHGNHVKPVPTCYGCGAAVEDEPGNYYCEPCIAGQLREQDDEREAFDAYHRFADACARRSR